MLSIHDRALWRDRAIIIAALAIVTVASWAYLFAGAGMEMQAADDAGAMVARDWAPERLAIVFVMWVVMMTAMMLPSAAPMILLHRRVDRKGSDGPARSFRAGIFAGGYLLVWAGFSLAATVVQWALNQWALLTPAIAFNSKPAVAALLMAAGLYQVSPLKDACLRSCRSPLSFLVNHWRDDFTGILMMGMRHGLYCVGCCWVLMALLFVGGVMNMLWIAGLTIWVLAEKVAPFGERLARMAGYGLIIAAVAIFAL